jgi:hypothetical protein
MAEEERQLLTRFLLECVWLDPKHGLCHDAAAKLLGLPSFTHISHVDYFEQWKKLREGREQ